MINPFLQSYQNQLVSLCRRYAVVRLYAFGSVTTTNFDEELSDVDLVVELPESLAPEQKGETYFNLLFDLERLFNRRVDLLMNPSFRNPYFAHAVEKSKELVYAA